MPNVLRQRPLTCLFAVAMACVFAVGLKDESQANSVTVILIAWTYGVGASAALSERHPLVRAAMFIAGIGIASFWLLRFESYQPEAVAILTAMGGCAFLGALATRAVMQSAIPPRQPEPQAKWQFSLMEVLGWMLVVAILSAALRFCRVEWLVRRNDESSYLVNGVVLGALAGLYLTPRRHCDRIATVVVALALAAAWLFPTVVEDWLGNDELLSFVHGVFGLWILVQRLDEAAEQRAERPPTLAVVSPDAEPSSET